MNLAKVSLAFFLLAGCTATAISPTAMSMPTSTPTSAPTATPVPTPVAGPARGGPWASKADMPTARYALSTSVVDGKIYAIGGTPDADGPSLSVVEAYDPATDTWIKKTGMPTARLALATAVVDGIIYAIGGTPEESNSGAVLATVEAYDPTTDTWTRKADMPTARLGLSASVVDGVIYAIGGLPTQLSLTSTVEAYDPATDTWTSKAGLPTQLGFHSSSALDGKIYVFGGGSTYGSVGRSAYVYDPETDTWATLADMPDRSGFFSTSAVDGKICTIGGFESIVVSALSTVRVYDPATDTWATKTDMPIARHFHSASVVDGKIYVIGGRIRHTSSPEGMGFATVEEYTPEGSSRESWDYVVLGDSFAARSKYPEFYSAHIEENLGVEIELRKRASSGQPTEANLDRVLNNEVLRNLIAEAEVITINWGPSSLDRPERVYLNGECGGKDNQDCLRLAGEEIQRAWEQLLDEIIGLRGSEKTIIRTFAFGTWPELAYFAGSGALISPEQLDVLVDNFLTIDRRLMETAAERGILVVDLFEAFQQSDAQHRPPEEYFQSDHLHLSEQGSQVVADLLRDLGYEFTVP